MTPSPRILAFGLSFFFAAAASAADIPKPPEVSRIKNDVYKMRSGTTRVNDPDNPQQKAENLKKIQAVAEWLAYTIATPPYNGELVPREDKTPAFVDRSMAAHFSEAERFADLPVSSGNFGKISVEQAEYGAEFGKAIAKTTKVVLDNSARPIERINAVRLIAVTARLPAPDLADPLVDIVNNTKISDAEKLYAFQGLKNLMEQTDLVDPAKHVVRDVNQLAKIAKALSDYITQNRNPRDDRERAVIEYVRRHAVTALAALKDGVYRKPNRDLIYRPSWTLMRVIGNDPSISPPFTVQEKVEAIVGFCQMKNDPEMNLDVAAYMVAVAPLPTASGTVLGGLVEFARAANQDVLRANKEGTLPAVHWKVSAARMSLALANWRESVKTLAKARYPENVTTLARDGIALLAQIEKEGGGAQTATEVQALTQWATNNPPKAWGENPPKPAQLYKDDPQSIVPFAAPAKKASTDAKLTTPMPEPKAKTPPPVKGPDPKAKDPKKSAPPAKK
jgi:hypothetical protein